MIEIYINAGDDINNSNLVAIFYLINAVNKQPNKNGLCR
jgi:hypothetical protein